MRVAASTLLTFLLLVLWTAALAQTRIPPDAMANPVPTTIVTNASAAVKLGGVPAFMVEPFWPKPLPNNWILGQVSGVAVDKRDHVWIVQRPRSLSEREAGAQQSPPWSKCCYAAPPVLAFDQSGNLLRAWGGAGQGYEWPETEHGIYVDDNDFVWTAGSGRNDSQILKSTLDGKFVVQIGRSGQSNGSSDTQNLGSPADMFVDTAAKELYVADGYRNHRVIVSELAFSPDRDQRLIYMVDGVNNEMRIIARAGMEPVARVGRPGRYAGQFHVVHNVAVDRQGNVYTTEVNTGQRVQKFKRLDPQY